MIASMTGFARAEGQAGMCSWTWEVRSVNGRGLETRTRLPPGFESVDPAVRQRIASALKRGNVSAHLAVVWAAGAQQTRINAPLLEQVLGLAWEMTGRYPGFRPPSIDGLLGLRGIVEVLDPAPTGDARAALEAELLQGFDRALAGLVAARRAEGARLHEILGEQLRNVRALATEARTIASTQPAAILERLREHVAELSRQTAISDERLAQEAVLLASKADAREEIDRLAAHCDAADALLAKSAPVGRQLDFLCQEFNREANTLGSKASDIALTRIALNLKSTIEQFREQVQNIE